MGSPLNLTLLGPGISRSWVLGDRVPKPHMVPKVPKVPRGGGPLRLATKVQGGGTFGCQLKVVPGDLSSLPALNVKIHPYFNAVLHVVLLGQILCGLVV